MNEDATADKNDEDLKRLMWSSYPSRDIRICGPVSLCLLDDPLRKASDIAAFERSRCCDEVISNVGMDSRPQGIDEQPRRYEIAQNGKGSPIRSGLICGSDMHAGSQEGLQAPQGPLASACAKGRPPKPS